MAGEFLWLSHIQTDRRLKDVNFNIFTGEILFLLCSHQGELTEIREVIMGAHERKGGMIFLKEQPTGIYNEETAVAQGIFHMSAKEHLVEKLSVAENIFVIRRKKGWSIFDPFSQKLIARETNQVLQKIGLSCDPAAKVYNLKPFERFQVCLAKAIVNHAKLLLIDETETAYNYREYKKMRELLETLRQDNIASLILADRPGELLDGARKIVLIKDGRDVKTFYSQEKGYFDQAALDQMINRIWLGGGISGNKVRENRTKDSEIGIRGKTFCLNLKVGNIYGIYDGAKDMRKSFLENILDFGNANESVLAMTGEEKDFSLTEMIKQGKVVYIPKESQELLLENMGIGENLAISNRERVSRWHGLTAKRVEDFLEEEFCREFQIKPGTPVWQLNNMQRKILSVYRFLFKRPKLLIMENPTYRMNLVEAQEIRKYLKMLTLQGIILLISENSFYEETQVCDAIIYMECNKYKSVIDKEDFCKVTEENVIF